MSKRETDIKRIADYFALAENMLNNKAILGYNDDSRTWEDVICRVINIAYSWKLVNLNKSTNNYPGIDLGDKERRIGVQVTKEHTSDKVNSSLDKIIRNKVYERYSEIYVFVLGRKQKTYQIKEEFQAQSLFHFDKQDNIWDFQTLLMHCQNIESEKLEEIASYLEYELDIFQGNGKQDTHNDRLNKYIDHQKSESGFIKILGLRNSLPIDNVWIQLKLLNVDDRNQVKKEGEQAGPLSVYDEYKVYGERGSSFNVNTIIAYERNTVVLAGPGMGKSTLCKKLFMLALGESKCAARVRLWDVAKYIRQGMVFEESLRMAMAAPLSFCLSKAELDNIFSVLILDGLDECGDISRTVAKDISEWSNGHDNVQVIVTSRPVGYDDAELYDYIHL
ncbi:MAG: SMEK domain-containing protein [Lachnospiraceae bacterium]|nr:SMEK domain-containing protein [Lachnospiraceae bacterium]